jgi:hypothetical protein
MGEKSNINKMTKLQKHSWSKKTVVTFAKKQKKESVITKKTNPEMSKLNIVASDIPLRSSLSIA